MFRIKESAIARALQEGGNHTFTATQGENGYFILTIDNKALLETERGKPREFRRLDALVSLLVELGINQFTVSLKPALANTKKHN